jgi:hypothetical protein
VTKPNFLIFQFFQLEPHLLGARLFCLSIQEIGGWAWWHTPANLATRKAEIGGLRYEAWLGNNSRPYLTNNLKQKGLEAWLQWYCTCLENTRLSSQYHQKKKPKPKSLLGRQADIHQCHRKSLKV